MDSSQLNEETNSSFSLGVSTLHHQHTHGKMRWAPTTEYLQGVGGEQDDPILPLLFDVGQHRALTVIQDHLMEGEPLFAFLDDIYFNCKPKRVADVHSIMERCLFHCAHIRAHHGKTKMWNRSGRRPTGVLFDKIPAMEDLQSAWLVFLFCAALEQISG